MKATILQLIEASKTKSVSVNYILARFNKNGSPSQWEDIFGALGFKYTSVVLAPGASIAHLVIA